MFSTELLEEISRLSTPFICGAAVVHVFVFLYLSVWSNRDLRRISAEFERFTRGLNHRSVLEPYSSLSDQIDAFLADIRDVLENPARTGERRLLLDRLVTLDEHRKYLQSQGFETLYNVARNMIEAYPMAGVLGTIIAIGCALQQTTSGDGRQTIQAIVQFFGNSIWATFAGLSAAIVLMFINSFLETKFRRLTENREAARETVALARRELAISPADAAQASSAKAPGSAGVAR
ncbi:MAG: MotA/TolQ/ExbB proton channel [Planctomyces sp.]|nr:MotA/TolQ/ExbB proton channel [Planctomyces sp.]